MIPFPYGERNPFGSLEYQRRQGSLANFQGSYPITTTQASNMLQLIDKRQQSPYSYETKYKYPQSIQSNFQKQQTKKKVSYINEFPIKEQPSVTQSLPPMTPNLWNKAQFNSGRQIESYMSRMIRMEIEELRREIQRVKEEEKKESDNYNQKAMSLILNPMISPFNNNNNNNSHFFSQQISPRQYL